MLFQVGMGPLMPKPRPVASPSELPGGNCGPEGKGFEIRAQGVAPSFCAVSSRGVFQLKPVKPPPPVPDAAPLIGS